MRRSDGILTSAIICSGTTMTSFNVWKWSPHRWPLARLSIPLQKIVDRPTRVVAGCCWEVMVTRPVPLEWLKSLRQVAKCLTMLLAGDLAKEVAAIFREVYTHPSKQLYDNTCCAPTIGTSPSIRNCCTPHRDTMPPSQVNERGRVVALQE